LADKTGRLICILRTPDGEIHCMDYYCYHMAGPLGAGELVDIEEVAPHGRQEWPTPGPGLSPVQAGLWAHRRPRVAHAGP